MSREYEFLGSADPEVVKEYLSFLVDAFDSYRNAQAEQGKELGYREAFMVAHNFHKMIVLDLEKRVDVPAGYLCAVAKSTWDIVMEEYIEQGAKK